MPIKSAAFAILAMLLTATAHAAAPAALADLVIATGGATKATIVSSPEAGTWEKQAATDLQKYIEMMSGAKPALAASAEANAAALRSAAPLLVVGQEALKAKPSLVQSLAAIAKKNPTVRADAVIMQREGNRVYLVGTNDESHYFAASWLLQKWGCRWYLPTEFGECIPTVPTLTLGALNFAYAPPFEIRHYWLSWNGDTTGATEFRRRNFMTETTMGGMGHALGEYVADIVPPGKTKFNVPFSEDATVQHIAEKIAAKYADPKTGSISLAIEDGSYETGSARDTELAAGVYDKYMMNASLTEPMMTLYNRVAKTLRLKYPDSKTKIGGMAYVNVTIPPQYEFKAEPNLVMWLAPIDIDPIHGMDDPNSPPRQEYRAMMHRWADLMKGQVAIYDYDQGMLVWRDMPNPSYRAFAQDVKHYCKAGILGIGTESRGAMATTFTNLFFRGQLMWNPDANVDTLLAEFYPKFYGPAAAPMRDYWTAIEQAWDKTIVTEHEYFLAPAIYTPELVAGLKKNLEAAEAITRPLQSKASPSREEKLLLDRMKFTRLSFVVIESYMASAHAAAAETDFKTAVLQGERGLAARMALTKMNLTFTTHVLGIDAEHEKSDAAWWMGEAAQYRALAKLTDGTAGTLIAKTPLEWSFRRDPHDTGLASGWAYTPFDLSYYQANKAKYSLDSLKDYPTTQAEVLSTDLYAQAQGVRHPDRQSFTGYLWYQTPLTLNATQVAGKTRLMFPGLFNEAWLYVNGNLVSHREQRGMWWYNNYKFEWDVDLSGKLRAGENTITVRLANPHHFGGIFRRPFLYRPVS